MEKNLKTIELLAPHTHAGRDYPIGGVITIDADAADWLIGCKRAKEATKGSRALNEAAPAKG